MKIFDEMKFVFRKVSHLETEIIESVCELLNTSYDKSVSEYFIYREKNYVEFLTRSLSLGLDIVYVVLNPNDDKLIGFAQIKISDQTVFLNNIIIKPEYRGHNIASDLLLTIVIDTAIAESSLRFFSLDVFEKNASVMKWYQRLGMNIAGSKFWYQLLDNYNGSEFHEDNNESKTSEINVLTDNNGFNQVYSRYEHLGTLINGNKLIVRHNPGKGTLKLLKGYFQNRLMGLCFITTERFDYPIIDKAIRLQIVLEDLRNNLIELKH